MNHYHVAAGILRDAKGRILITQRLCDGPFNGLWEFPGGKIGNGEDPTEALKRELAEELGIEVTASTPFMDLLHEYPDRTVDLQFFLVTAWQGHPTGLEGQGVLWLAPGDLNPDALLPADAPVVEALLSL
ncbi:MAG: 8-oxo-dGTP diphosphatase MutT [Gammaproteobacteria bacterium]|nr:8-oxo-dGTP diphosphatase MutT [Gammaproteobacteria bacterium]MDH3373989.1 8-oxo-dGTP diphosphatase MutT [Gammaproteobacteria bacterium]MDH3410524.1 8-oxo-dGTP diphosphatase MutT [Gammaproteobacteria bacterium]